ncbi:MAG: hypothetical protein CMJ62_09205 [Planctomycetaceae bacterium]|nr:hypothetical protein [Planctomycetaceae bacterium]
MRLTLRTMLAYLDEVLDSDDTHEIGQKIEGSRFATDLAHRTRGCVRRLKLPAPELNETAGGRDTNTVSEYLDSTLPDDHVSDFEKVCLDSDVHLAEAASCHQILTLVLGEPAQVSVATRDRMYRVGRQQIEEDPSLETGLQVEAGLAEFSAGTAAVNAAVEKSKRSGPEIPDYLRDDPKRSWGPIVAIFLLAVAVTLGGLAKFGMLDPAFVAFTGGEFREGAIEQNGEGVAELTSAQSQFVEPLPEEFQIAEDQTQHPSENPAGDSLLLAEGQQLSEEGQQPGRAENPPVGDVVSQSSESSVANSAILSSDQSETATVNEDTTSEVGQVSTIEQVNLIEPLQSEPQSVEPIDMGRYVSDQQVLVHFNAETKNWYRFGPRAPLHSGDRLMSLPKYRPQILLSAGLRASLIGGTLVQLHAQDPLQPKIKIHFGRVLLKPESGADAPLVLDLPNRELRVEFRDAESELAVEVRRFHPPGTDSRATAAHDEVRFIPTSGAIQLTGADQPPQTIMAGQTMQFYNEAAGQVDSIEKFPNWISGRDIAEIDHRAAVALEQDIVLNRPLILTLLEKNEASEERRKDVRALATECLIHLGEFEPAIKAFRDVTQKPWWESLFKSLQFALARDRDFAQEVASAFEKHRGEDAAALLQLLDGYDAPELEQQGARQLVAYLNHGEMDYRVLALENLKRIMEVKPIYNPRHTAVQRRKAVQHWRMKLERGEIQYKSPPLDIPDRKDSTTDS